MSKEAITLSKIEKGFDSLKKKLFIYETLNAEKDIKEKRINGPFKTGKEIIKAVKS